MMLRHAAVALLALAVFANPAAAAPGPQVTDECGDAGTRGEWNGDSLDVEDSRPHLDLASGHLAGTYDSEDVFTGFTAAITVCGEVSSAEGGYHLGWGYGDNCYGGVSWTIPMQSAPGRQGLSGAASAAAGPQAVLTEQCFREQETPLDEGVETIYEVVLPEESFSFDGDTLTFTIPTSLLPAEAAPRMAPGTLWAGVYAVAMDQGPSLWAFYGDTEGNNGRLAVRTDFALNGADYVVGEDATG